MKKLLCALLGALAIGTAVPSAEAMPLEPAVYRPAVSAPLVQTVQYRSHYRPHYARRGFHHRHGYRNRFAHRPPRPFYHRGPGYARGPGFARGPVPFRHY